MVSRTFYIGCVKILLHGRGESAVSYDEKGTWVYLVTSAGAYAVYLAIILVRLASTPAAQVPYIREQLDRMGIDVPLVGDFHYNGHTLLADNPAAAEALAKYRINPGNVGFKD